jgi:hypothetical protein
MSLRKKSALGLGILVAVIAVLAVAAVLLVRPERLKETALQRAREATGYAIEAGPAGIHVGLSGVGVRVEDLRAAAPDSSQVIRVAEADVYAKLWPLVRKRVELRRVVLHRPVLELRAAVAGGATSGGAGGIAASASPAFAFLAVESWAVEDGGYVQHGPAGTVTLDAVDLAGGFSWTATHGAAGNARGTVGSGLWSGEAGTFVLPGFRTRVDFRLNAAGDTLDLPAITLASGPVQATLSGSFARLGKEWAGALEGRMGAVRWDAIRSILPEEDLAALSGVDLDGSFALPGLRIERTRTGENRLSGRLVFSEVSVKAPSAPLGLTAAEGTVDFAPGVVAVEKGKGRLGDHGLSFSARLEGSPPSRIEASVATHIDGSTLAGLLPAEMPLTLERGTVDLDLSAVGPFPVKPSRLPEVTGTVDLAGFAGTYRALPIRNGRGRLRFAGHGVEVRDLGASLGRSDFTVNGSLADLARPDLRFTWTSDRLDLNELFPQASGAPSDTGDAAPLVGVPGSGTVHVKSLRFRKTEARDVIATVTAGLDGIRAENASAKLYGGAAAGRLALVPVAGGKTWRYDGKVDAKGVGIGQVLADWTPVGNRVEGTASAAMTFSGSEGPGTDPLRSLDLSAVTDVRQGAFRNVPALQSIARYLNVKEAVGERWPFQDLTAGFMVKEGRLVVDTLRVTQTGLGWRLEGAVGLDGSLAMTGTLLADPARIDLPSELQILAPYVAQADGRIPVDFRLSGGIADPTVSVDWDALGKRAAEKAKREERDKLQKELEKSITDPKTLQKLKNLLGGKKGNR